MRAATRTTLIAILALSALIAATLVSAQQEPPRIALLIGNAAYSAKVGPLKNPHNDVALLEAALTKLKFKVKVLKDAGYRDMDTAIKRHIADVAAGGPGAVSFFYYTGHGAANPDTQTNYLIPTDVQETETTEVWIKSFDQGDLIDKLSRQAPRATHYVIFDACRNELRLTAPGNKSIGTEKGFVPVAQTAGLLIAYATAPKQTASDVGDGGGPYAKALAAEIVKPGFEAVTMFRNVQLKVKQSIGQDPWLSFPSLPEVYLAGRDSAATTAAPRSPAAEAWSLAESSNSETALNAFVQQYGADAFYAGLAREKLAALRQARTQPPPAAPVPSIGARPPETKMAGTAPLPSKLPAAAVLPANARTPAGTAFRDCPTCPDMVVVPAGEFMMGSDAEKDEQPIRKVKIARPFAVGRFEITEENWEACLQDGGCGDYEPWKNQSPKHRGQQPAANVSFNDAKVFMAWLSKKSGKTYRLLSEAEWEYAARAGTTTRFPWGRDGGAGQANCSDCGSQFNGKIAPAGSFPANPFGLHDMHGNVWEVVEDCYVNTYGRHPALSANNVYGPAPSDGTARIDDAVCKDDSRVLRGGAYNDTASVARSSARYRTNTTGRNPTFGFRVARPLD